MQIGCERDDFVVKARRSQVMDRVRGNGRTTKSLELRDEAALYMPV
jgi:hypothetical protein